MIMWPQDPEHLAMRSAQDLGAINRSLFQLHGLAVRFEREWVNPWRDTDTPATDADVQPPPLQRYGISLHLTPVLRHRFWLLERLRALGPPHCS